MKHTKLLVVDDDKELRELIQNILNLNGYSNVLLAQNSEEALKIIQGANPDLILLDIMMPGIDGLELLKLIREISKVPVIMLTAKGEAEDKYKGFGYGADDYIVKPFLMKELILRIEAVLRRTYPEKEDVVYLEGSYVDLGKAEVVKEGKTFQLTAKEFAIFSKLYQNANRIVSTPALCQTVIGEVWTGYESTLMSHISHLREKIEKNPGKPVNLITIRGLGYRLNVKE